MNTLSKLALATGAVIGGSVAYRAAEIATMTYTVSLTEITQRRGLLNPREIRIDYDDLICWTEETTEADELLGTTTLHVTVTAPDAHEHDHETITLNFVPPTSQQFLEQATEGHNQ